MAFISVTPKHVGAPSAIIKKIVALKPTISSLPVRFFGGLFGKIK